MRGGRRLHGATPKFAAILRSDPCSYCGNYPPKNPKGRAKEQRKRMTVDHIVPRRLGKVKVLDTGLSVDSWTNLTACCYDCNQQRGTQPILQFLLAKRTPLDKALL